MRRIMQKTLPHVAVVLSLMYVVFFIIDMLNQSMGFINNTYTKVIMLVLCMISIINAVLLLWHERRAIRREEQRKTTRR